MHRSRMSFAVLLLTLVSMLLFGLTGVLAADVKPSFEFTGVNAVNGCQGGAHYSVYLNHNGVGSAEGWIGSEGHPEKGSFGWTNFGNSPVGTDFLYSGYPAAYPDNTIVYFEVSTFSGANGAGHRTFYSKISFNCTTGEQVGPVINVAYPDGMPRPNFDIVDGPAFEHPGDIASFDPGILVVRPELVGDPVVRPQDIGRINLGN